MNFEYIRLRFDFGDLSEMNRLSSIGWKVIAVVDIVDEEFYALLERPLPKTPEVKA